MLHLRHVQPKAGRKGRMGRIRPGQPPSGPEKLLLGFWINPIWIWLFLILIPLDNKYDNQDRFQYSLNGNEPNHHFQNRFDFYSDRTDLISIRFEQNRNQIVSENGGF